MNNKKRDCFTAFAMTGQKCAFTLSEVLIVLAVLGVIAAMTIPSLIQDAQEKALITALKKNYSIFEQAVEMATAENGPIMTWDIGDTAASRVGALKLYNMLKPYLRIEKDCGLSNGCFADHYEALFNTNYEYEPATAWNFARGVLASGTSFAVWSNGICSGGFCGYISVDVNGTTGPNKAGVDFFYIKITEDGLMPFSQQNKCTYGSNAAYNGVGCTWWAITHENMDYLRKAGTYTN